MESTFALLAKLRFGFSEQTMGRLFAVVGVMIAVVQGGLIGPLARRFGEVAIGCVGFLILTIAFGIIPGCPVASWQSSHCSSSLSVRDCWRQRCRLFCREPSLPPNKRDTRAQPVAWFTVPRD